MSGVERARRMNDAAVIDLWWKNSLVYCIDPKVWRDGNGDGIGDLAGLTDSLDYVSGLGINCIWLMPICESPWQDDGYDISNYYSVDPRLGDLGDFVTFVNAAHAMGIRVVIDMALNHTSNQHPWFRAARSDPESPYRDYYVWRDEPPPDPPDVVFPGEQETTWTYDESAGQYYLHRYYEFMPDLNSENPNVREEMYKILGFWLALGVDGFRVDSVPFLVEEIGASAAGEDASHDYLRDLAAFISRRRGNAILIGEANIAIDQLPHYFGKPGAEEMQVLFDFLTGPSVWLALSRGEAGPIVAGLRRRPEHPPVCQYLTFLRHHDELTFENTLSEDEAQEVFDEFAPAKNERIYGRGIRRRLAPMLDGDMRRLRLAFSILLSLPGAPMIFYGDEIGIGDDLDLPGRIACRVPMQWNDRRNGGFSAVDPENLFRPCHADGGFGHKTVNVSAQQRDPDSLLNWLRRAFAIRRQCPAVGWGEYESLDVGDHRVLALRYRWNEQLFILNNLSGEQVTAHAGDLATAITDEVLADSDYPPAEPDGAGIALEPYGFRWFHLLLDTEERVE